MDDGKRKRQLAVVKAVNDPDDSQRDRVVTNAPVVFMNNRRQAVQVQVGDFVLHGSHAGVSGRTQGRTIDTVKVLSNPASPQFSSHYPMNLIMFSANSGLLATVKKPEVAAQLIAHADEDRAQRALLPPASVEAVQVKGKGRKRGTNRQRHSRRWWMQRSQRVVVMV